MRVGIWIVICCAAAMVPVHLEAQPRYDPHLKFRTISTPRFDIYYHQREESLAQRLAGFVEGVAADIDRQLGAPQGRVRIILVDQTDESNGWATVVPYNLIELAAVPPPSQSMIGNTDDWLRLVFSHEYTHVVHLEKSRGWLGSLRHVFGRVPLFYSNLLLPKWQIEGLATYEESVVTGKGRVPAADFRMILDQAAVAGRLAPLDRVNGGMLDWPSGNAAYLYGAYFHQYLSEKYGAESLTRLADETARRLPFFGSRAYRAVFGRSLGLLWKDFEADIKQKAGSAAGDGRTRLTRHGFLVNSPVFAENGRLFYSISNPHGVPALMELRPNGGAPRQITTRYGGDRIAAAGRLLVFDQIEVVRNTAQLRDLYAVSLDTGETRRLTREARAGDPDVAPDGRTIVCTVQLADRRILATLTLPPAGETTEPTPLVSEISTEFSWPRWSPDGRSIVAERRTLHGPSEIVVVDVDSRAVRTVVTDDSSRNMTPAWLPGGSGILFSSDRNGQPFALHSVDIRTGEIRSLQDAGTGAQSPVLSPDGRQLVFVGYSADGYDLYSVPLDPSTWTPARAGTNGEPTARPPSGSAPLPRSATVAVESRPYRPWSTLAPRFWLPIVEVDDDDWRVGAATSGFDALGRHAYVLAGAWSTENRPFWEAYYAYSRWRPTLFAAMSEDTNAFRQGEIRTRDVDGGVVLPVRRMRWASATLAALHASSETIECATCETPLDFRRKRRAVQLGWNITSARSFGYSISAEQGAYAGITTELTRMALGADADAGAATADVRGYVRAFPRHAVLAARLAGASAWGDESMRRIFSASGSGPRGAGFGFDGDAIGLMRGFDEGDVAGRRAAVVNLDYRFPLLDVQRGVGTLPFFLQQVHGAVFADVGSAWDSGFDSSDLRRSFGAELSFDAVLGYSLPIVLTTGGAWRHDPVLSDNAGWAAFVRIGRAF
jgi:hypothetical protein